MNTQALTEPVDNQALLAYAKAGKSFGRNKKILRFFVVVMGIMFVSIGASIFNASAVPGTVFILVAIFTSIYVFSHADRLMVGTKRQQFQYERFADANDLEYMHEPSNWQMPESFKGSALKAGIADDHWLNNAIVGKSLSEQKKEFAKTHNAPPSDGVITLLEAFCSKSLLPRAKGWLGKSDIVGDKDVAFFQHHYTTGSGKNRRDHYWQVSAYRLPRKLPHILIDSRKNNSFLGSNIATSFKKDQKIDAGILSKHFDVYVPNGYSIDALSFIGPDVVEQIIAHGIDSELEIIDDVLFIYTKKKLSPKNLVEMANQQTHIIEKLGDNLASYRDERATSIANRSSIAEEGIRLKKSIWPAVVAMIGVFGFSAVQAVLSLRQGSIPFAAITTAAIPSLILYATIKANRSKPK